MEIVKLSLCKGTIVYIGRSVVESPAYTNALVPEDIRDLILRIVVNGHVDMGIRPGARGSGVSGAAGQQVLPRHKLRFESPSDVLFKSFQHLSISPLILKSDVVLPGDCVDPSSHGILAAKAGDLALGWVEEVMQG